MNEAARTTRAAAESDYTALRKQVAELAHKNSGRVDVFEIASTGFHTGWTEYLPDAHSGIVRVVIAGFKPRERAPGILLRALGNVRSLQPLSGAAGALSLLLGRVAAKDTQRVDVFTLPGGAGFRGIAEYMPESGSVMVRITIQGICERDRVETLLLRTLEDLLGEGAEVIVVGQQNLFGEPEFQPSLGQWHSPPWLCRRLVQWVPVGKRILEPGCGSGHMIDALLRAGHAPESITGVELDEKWATFARHRFEKRVDIHSADFLKMRPTPRLGASSMFDVAIGNFPFEDNAHTAFTRHALKFAPVVIAVYPAGFEFSQERDADLWASRALAVRRARIPERVDYGGDQSPSFDSIALKIIRRHEPRPVGEVVDILEEVWRRAA